jgi:hypothetical protein
MTLRGMRRERLGDLVDVAHEEQLALRVRDDILALETLDRHLFPSFPPATNDRAVFFRSQYAFRPSVGPERLEGLVEQGVDRPQRLA